jgi:hypothetical protein
MGRYIETSTMNHGNTYPPTGAVVKRSSGTAILTDIRSLAKYPPPMQTRSTMRASVARKRRINVRGAMHWSQNYWGNQETTTAQKGGFFLSMFRYATFCVNGNQNTRTRARLCILHTGFVAPPKCHPNTQTIMLLGSKGASCT